MSGGYSPEEMMVVAAARRLRDGERVFVGVGLPNLACNLAKRLHAPGIEMIYESGVVGANPSRLPLSIGDPALALGARQVCSMFDVFALYLQRGLVDVGFLGAAQIDRWGNLNSTVIGAYDRPKVRMAGSGGAADIALLARRVFILLRHESRRFVESVDFITSPGHPGGPGSMAAQGRLGGGPEVVITDLGELGFDTSGEMVLTSLHPGVTVADVRARTGWDLRVAGDVATASPPSEEELSALRALDVGGLYL